MTEQIKCEGLINEKEIIKVLKNMNNMKEVRPGLFHSEQRGFLKDRYIGEYIYTVADSLQYTKQKQLTGILQILKSF